MKWSEAAILALFFTVLFFVFSFRVPAQEYKVTESQLQSLEKILETYKDSRQKALSQVSELQASLKQERILTQNLNASCTKYEIKVAEQAQELAETKDEKHKLEMKIKTYIIAIIIEGAIILIGMIVSVVYVLIRLKII